MLLHIALYCLITSFFTSQCIPSSSQISVCSGTSLFLTTLAESPSHGHSNYIFLKLHFSELLYIFWIFFKNFITYVRSAGYIFRTGKSKTILSYLFTFLTKRYVHMLL